MHHALKFYKKYQVYICIGVKTIAFLSQYLYHILYALTLVVAVVKYPRYYDSVLKYFPILIAYTLLTEILGWYIFNYDDFQIVYEQQIHEYEINNALIYNIFDIVFYLYFFLLYRRVLTKPKHKSFIRYGTVVFIAISIINAFFKDFLLYPQIYAILVGSLVLVGCVFLYLRECAHSDDGASKYNNLLFWISVGLLSFYPFYPILMIVGVNLNELYVQTFQLIHRLLISIMYVCFIIGFLRMYRFKITGKPNAA